MALVVAAAGAIGRLGAQEPPPRAAGARPAGRAWPSPAPALAESLFPPPGRPVAPVVAAAARSNETERDRWGEADTVMALLAVRAGEVVAEIGAGNGYYAVRLARRVGPSGHVFAEDIVPASVRRLQQRSRREGLANLTTILGDPHDPRLPAGVADLLLLAHVYHEIERPHALIYNALPALAPGGRLAVVDVDRPTARHGTPPGLLRCELAALGLERTALHRLPGRAGYLAVFEPAAAPPAPAAIQPCPAAAPA